MVKTIFLDLDDTLLDFDQAEYAAIGKTFTAFGLTPTDALRRQYAEINRTLWAEFERGNIERETLLIRRFDLLFAQLGIDLSSQEAERLYQHNLGIGHYFVEGAEQLLQRLAVKYDLYLASNGVAATQYSRIKSAGIGHYFKEIFISDTAGAHKPDPAYFAYCFSRIPNFSKAQALMVGDSLTSDILGGQRAGIRTCWFNRKNLPHRPDIQPDFEIHHLSELPGILENDGNR